MTTRRAQQPIGHAQGAGLLLLRGNCLDVRGWAAKGVVPVQVGRSGGWTVLLPAGASQASPPYDEALPMLAARPVPPRLGPGLGFWVIGDRAVITVAGARRGGLRWVVWEHGHGLTRPPGLDLATPDEVIGAASGGARSELLELLSEHQVKPPVLLAAIVTALDLPGARLLIAPSETGQIDGLTSVQPDPAQVAYFEDAVRDAVLLRRELELES